MRMPFSRLVAGQRLPVPGGDPVQRGQRESRSVARLNRPRSLGYRLAMFAGSVLAAGGAACGQDVPTGPLPPSVRYALLIRSEPRPLRIHVLSIDLRDPGLSFRLVAAQDPDGDGPAETVLTAPKVLAARGEGLAAINTVAWSMLPDPATGKAPGYVVGGRADVHGWVEQDGRLLSPPEPGFWSVWMGEDRRPAIGLVPSKQDLLARKLRVSWAVSGFAGILKDNRVLPAPSDVRHPRTAVGLSRDGNTMVWLVVDGRQKGFSEGVSEEELARLLQEAGCSDGINLDGGGSSSLWIRGTDDRPTLINRPSDILGPRPVPVLLVLRHSDGVVAQTKGRDRK